MRKKTINTVDKIIGAATLTFFGFIAFMAFESEGFWGGLFILLKILGMALVSMLVLMLVVTCVLLTVAAYRRRKRERRIEREMFGPIIQEHKNKKKGVRMDVAGPNKFAR